MKKCPARQIHLQLSSSLLSTRASCNLTPTSLQSAMNIGRIPGPVVHPEGGFSFKYLGIWTVASISLVLGGD
ncbi:hypothetical protein [Methanobacterium aggregans]|uniref:hypothetical protein n=1 Tax=Methanobacterium aggregans TaxID=1615586 RepID=UPI001AE16282|nr:hypothetical protein [Methanobacterium aggregans]MBP2045289.1 hypothetical protein [Methanobacterium aggregans]